MSTGIPHLTISLLMKNKVPQVTIAFWVIKIAGDHARRDRRRRIVDDAESRLRDQHRDFLRDLCRDGGGANRFVQVAPGPLLDGYRRHNDGRHHDVRLSDPNSRARLPVGRRSSSSPVSLPVLAIWYFTLGSVNVNHITNRKAETFYWLTILTSNTLGTALGDCLADTSGLGYEGGASRFWRCASDSLPRSTSSRIFRTSPSSGRRSF